MLQIPLPPHIEETLRERAKSIGEDVSTYAAYLIREALSLRSVDEFATPIKKQVEESWISDGGLDQLRGELRREIRIMQSREAKTEP